MHIKAIWIFITTRRSICCGCTGSAEVRKDCTPILAVHTQAEQEAVWPPKYKSCSTACMFTFIGSPIAEGVREVDEVEVARLQVPELVPDEVLEKSGASHLEHRLNGYCLAA
jgi:hypothetical protein